jgi:hypothetical protein
MRVRIAVAVDATGLWSAAGHCSYETNDEAAQAALDYLPQESSPTRHIVWVKAEVPLPSHNTIKGIVETGGEDE